MAHSSILPIAANYTPVATSKTYLYASRASRQHSVFASTRDVRVRDKPPDPCGYPSNRAQSIPNRTPETNQSPESMDITL